jgi:hypothetical protein
MGGADLEFADWLLPVPEGTPIRSTPRSPSRSEVREQ